MMIDQLNIATKNMRYVIEEIKKKDRGFEDMDLTLRLHMSIKQIDEVKTMVYSALRKRGEFI